MFVPELFISKYVFDFSKVVCKDLSVVIIRDKDTRVQIFDEKLFNSLVFTEGNKIFIGGIKVNVFRKIIASIFDFINKTGNS